jgi:hypothetical protein
MRKSGWTPSIVPHGDDQNVYLVVDDLGAPRQFPQAGEARATCLKEQGAPPAQIAPLSSFSTTRGRTRSAAQAFRDYFSGLDIPRGGPRRAEVVRRQTDNAFRRPERSRLRAR